MSAEPSGTKVVIAGAGPAGLTAAYELCRRGGKPVVFESAGNVGGHARTEEYRGYRFDIGGHRFFTKIDEVDRIWREVLGDRFLRVPRMSRIYFDGKFFDYPLRIGNVVSGLGVLNSFLIVMSFLAASLFPHREEENFEQWVSNRFGRRLYLTFFKTYTEKVWGIPCDQISAEWAAQRIQGLSLRTAVRNALLGDRKNAVKSLIQEFDYPELGPGMMWEWMRDRVEAGGGRVELNREVVEFHRRDDRIAGVTVGGGESERRIEADEFIASMPLTDVVSRMIPPPPAEVVEAAGRLRYRDFLTVCVIVDHPDLFPDNWIYIHSPEVQMGRLQNFKNWSAAMVPDPDKTSLGAEYFVNVGDRLWQMADADLVALTAGELETLGLSRGAAVEDGVVYRQRKAYPVYDESYAQHLAILERFFKSIPNLHMIGRNGLHKYNNQDHSMLTALYAVDNIYGRRRDVWKVNTDQLYHEEAVEDA